MAKSEPPRGDRGGNVYLAVQGRADEVLDVGLEIRRDEVLNERLTNDLQSGAGWVEGGWSRVEGGGGWRVEEGAGLGGGWRRVEEPRLRVGLRADLLTQEAGHLDGLAVPLVDLPLDIDAEDRSVGRVNECLVVCAEVAVVGEGW